MNTYTIPAAAMQGDAGEREVPALFRGPFAIHRKVGGTRKQRYPWQVTHRPTGVGVANGGLLKRKQALVYAEWLASLPVDWEQDDAQAVAAEVQDYFRKHGISVLYDKMNELRAA